MAFCIRNVTSVGHSCIKLSPSNLAILQSRSAFWFRKDKKDKEEDAKLLEQVDKRKSVPGQDRHVKERLNLLAIKSKLDNKKPYSPPANVVDTVQKITLQSCDVRDGDWQSVSLAEPRLKYKILTKLIKEFDHDIPNSSMSNMRSVQDAVAFFQTDVRDTTPVEDMSKLDLPKNLHIQLEYQRFDPDSDTMFGGRTAFPGHDTEVTSIKYKRKYKSTKTRKDKPGYVNHYHGY